MARRRYLISYDIADQKRLRAVFVLMKGYGQWLQYSVFICDLSKGERALCERELRNIMELSADSVVFIDLGLPETADIQTLGVPRCLPEDRPVVV